MRHLLIAVAGTLLLFAGCNGTTPEPEVYHSANIVTLTDDNFDSVVLASSQPVLVDFGAEWCGYCKQMEPVVAQIADEFAGKAIVGKLDTDHNQATAEKYVERGIPLFLIFKDGEIVGRMSGAGPKEELVKQLNAALSAS